MNLTALQADVIRRLGETSSSLIAAYVDGSGNVVQAGTATITGFLNEGQSDICRRAFPVVDVAHSSFVIGQRTAMYSSFVCTSSASATLFSVRSAAWGASPLLYAPAGGMDSWPFLTAQATPTRYYDEGIDVIGLYPIPSTTGGLYVRGLIVPAPLVTGSDVPRLPADLQVLLSYYASAAICLMNRQDPVIQARGDYFRGLYEAGIERILATAGRLRSDGTNDLYGQLPSAMSAMQPQMSLGGGSGSGGGGQ